MIEGLQLIDIDVDCCFEGLQRVGKVVFSVLQGKRKPQNYVR